MGLSQALMADIRFTPPPAEVHHVIRPAAWSAPVRHLLDPAPRLNLVGWATAAAPSCCCRTGLPGRRPPGQAGQEIDATRQADGPGTAYADDMAISCAPRDSMAMMRCFGLPGWASNQPQAEKLMHDSELQQTGASGRAWRLPEHPSSARCRAPCGGQGPAVMPRFGGHPASWTTKTIGVDMGSFTAGPSVSLSRRGAVRAAVARCQGVLRWRWLMGLN